MLLGYASAIRAWAEEAETFLRIAQTAGATLLQAWILASMLHQDPVNTFEPPLGPTTYVAALWAEDGANPSPQDDRIPTRAYEYPPIAAPTEFVALWSPI
jgi:hypothetical protein